MSRIDYQRRLEKGASDKIHFDFQCESIEEKVKLLIFRDLFRLNWSIDTIGDSIICAPPSEYDKGDILQSMSIKRMEIIEKDKSWIDCHSHYRDHLLSDGAKILNSKIIPEIEFCENQEQHNIFRYFRYYWSSPYSDYVGRRIKMIVRDAAIPEKPIIGIAALGSPIIHIPERDEYIGWDKNQRVAKLNTCMDAYVIGALPPYNYMLGGKLMSYVVTSNEVRKYYEEKYRQTISVISKKKNTNLVGLFTTSLYGPSSQYNRLKFRDRILYNRIGSTKGYGTLHLTTETFNAMLALLKSRNISVSNRFGAGPIWAMRVIRQVGNILRFDSDFLLRHSFRRDIYYMPLASNTTQYLNGHSVKLDYFDQSCTELSDFWHHRWYLMRHQHSPSIYKVKNFSIDKFYLKSVNDTR